ncbi:TlpA family protein disulfide reductase [Nocardioides sp. LHG3406-4]|uniref:TlpA family protein disulfide reductase n=1 Tax=Nocardioides sp. LHG3406-4 TaxID=2804575 RepID=UPI003CFB66E2
MTRTVTLVPAVLLALLLGLLSALTGCTSVSGTGGKGYITGDGTVSQVDRADRGDPVELAGSDLDGNEVDLDDLRGKVVVINVWGSWCPPCRAEVPDLVAAAEQTADVASYLGINIRDSNQAQAQSFARNNGIEFPSIYSPDNKALLAFYRTLTPRSIPATVVLDRKGRVAASVLGRLPSTQTLTDLVDEVATEDG